MTDRITRQKVRGLLVEEEVRTACRLLGVLPTAEEPTMAERTDHALAYLQQNKRHDPIWPTQMYNLIISGGIVSAGIVMAFVLTCATTGVWP